MMNTNDTAISQAPIPGNAAFLNAPRMTALLARVTILSMTMLVASLIPNALTFWYHHAGPFWPAVRAALASPATAAIPAGILALARAPLILAMTAQLATLLIVSARARSVGQASASTWLVRVSGTPQAVLLCCGAGLALLSLGFFWVPPLAGATPGAPLAGGALVLPAALLFAGFLLLIGERAAVLIDPASLPEARGLAAIMRLPVIVLPALAVLCALAQRAPAAIAIGRDAIGILVFACAIEMAVRTLGVWYAPPPTPLSARAAVGSVVVSLLDPRQFSPTSLAVSLDRNFGIDFARSWALAFARRAALPVLAVLLCLCWGLSGASWVGLNQRAVYERLGAPVAVLDPGLHLLLPWPLGRARIVEYGIVHSILLSDAAAAGPATADHATAEGLAPASANRLWDQSRDETSYLVARVDEGHQSFEAISADLRVLYRTGLSPQAAREALYDTADPEILIRTQARRLLSRQLTTQTLSEVMVERHDQLAETLRAALQAELDRLHSGIEIVGLVVESLHPPAGAASAYRGVQAALIAAQMAIIEERGRARSGASLARRDANDVLDAAHAQASETEQSAIAEQTRMLADDRAWHAGGDGFLVERRLADLTAGLTGAPLEIIDSRIATRLLDLRSGAALNQAIDPEQEGHSP